MNSQREKKEEGEQSYFVVIPTYLFTDNKLSWKLKQLYGRIVSLCKKEGFCWASNRYLANEVKISERTVRRYLQKLKRLGEIDCEVNQPEGNIRRIWIKKKHPKDIPVPSYGHNKGAFDHSYGQPERGFVHHSNELKENELLGAKAPSASEKPTSDPRTKKLIDFFSQACKNIKGWSPEISGSIEGAMIKQKLKRYSADDLEEELDWFLNADESWKLGCTIKVALSVFVFNKWLAQRKTY